MRRPRHLRDLPRPRGRGGARHVPPGSLLPAQGRDPAAAGAARSPRPGRARPPPARGLRRARRLVAGPDAVGRGRGAAGASRLAGQRPRADVGARGGADRRPRRRRDRDRGGAPAGGPGARRRARPTTPTTGALDRAEAEALRRALDASGGNVSAAARELGIARSTLYRLARRLGVAL
ncbi:MAG: helix-turn-helix domain-containing protein [Kofleriaceae bacterium]|nr:helix-turn-helix domain-containing protein [Kofleriaceae bacterium]